MQRDSTNYDNLRKEVEDIAVKFFNEVLTDSYDYCILYNDILFGLYLLVQSKIINRYNIPIYTSVRIDTDLSNEFKNKKVLLLVNSVSDLNEWENLKSFIDRLEHKPHPLSLKVRILMAEKEIADELSLENHYFSNENNDSDNIVIVNLPAPEFNLSFGDLLNSNNTNHIFKSLDNSELTSALHFLFFSIFESDFMLDEDKETVIFTDAVLYLILLHFIENGTISNKKNKHIILCFELEKEHNKKIIMESTVITIVSQDKTKNTETIEDIKSKIFNINPKLAERDIYQEDLIHF